MIYATLCYIIFDNRVLMLHRVKNNNDYHFGKYNGLGGKFLDGENSQDCVIREVFEESGLSIDLPVYRGFLLFPGFDGVNDWKVDIYTASKFSGELTECEEGNLEWIPVEQVLSLNLWEGDKIFLPYILFKNSIITGKFFYKDKCLIDYDISETE